MIKKAHSLLLLGFFALCSLNLSATHIVGGNLNYEYLGNDQYKITLQLFRDCQGIKFEGDQSGNVKIDAVVGIFATSDNSFIQELPFKFSGETKLPPAVYDDCTTPPADNCYMTTTYTTIANLPPRAGGYTLHYQRCCRNSLVINIEDPLCTGTTYAAFIPGPEVVTKNSNPIITKWPESTICGKKPWKFDGSATDLDGDSLIYEMYQPYEGLTYYCGLINGGRTGTAGAPACAPSVPPVNCNNFATPVAPPFVSLRWKAPFSFDNMLGGTVPLQIDRFTGKMIATPGEPGRFVMGWKVKEYRKGVLISETLRDFQLIVVPCKSDVNASAVAPIAICSSNDVFFDNKSEPLGGLDFDWDFGVPDIDTDKSKVEKPTYTYPGKGTYTVTLTATLKNKPQCKSDTTAIVTLTDGFSSDFTYNTIPCSEEYLFMANSLLVPGGTTAYEWDFGDGSPKETIQNPRHTFIGTGPFSVKLKTSLIPDNPQNEVLGCSFEGTTTPVTPGPPPKLYIPNTFTPNKDGVNDLFMPRGVNYKVYYFQVRSRIGELMFETTDPNAGWDGIFKGRPCDPGVYGWFTKMKCDENSPEIFKKGNVTLIR